MRSIKDINHFREEGSIRIDDPITINGTINISQGMIDTLHHKDWLISWDIAAALGVIDRPTSVNLSLSIALHEEGREGDITPVTDPFYRWRKTVENYHRKDKTDRPRICICPLNLNTNHFTLLEVNEETKMIYHYNSTAGSGVIGRKTKSTLVRREVQVKDSMPYFSTTLICYRKSSNLDILKL